MLLLCKGHHQTYSLPIGRLSLSIYLSSHLLWPCRFFVGDKNLVNNQSLHGRCHRHQMIVASYAAMPIGMAKWLGKIWIYKKCKPLGLRHASSCPLHNSKELYVYLSLPAILKHLKAFLHSWLLLSNAYGITPFSNIVVINN